MPRIFNQYNAHAATLGRTPASGTAVSRSPEIAAHTAARQTPDPPTSDLLAPPGASPLMPTGIPLTPGGLALTPTDVNLPSYFHAKRGAAPPGTSSLGSPQLPGGSFPRQNSNVGSSPRTLKEDSMRPSTLPRMPRGMASEQPLLSTSQRYLTRYPPHPIMQQQYIIGEELGVGGFGFVVAAEKRGTREPVAIKFIFRVS